MAVIAFETLKHVERLTAAGVPDAQARAEASALRDVLSESLDTTIATKGAVQDLKVELKADIKDLKTELKADIERLEASTKAEIGRLEASTKTEIGRLENSTKAAMRDLKGDIERLEASTKADMALMRKDMQSMEIRLFAKLTAMIVTVMGAGIGILVAVLRVAH